MRIAMGAATMVIVVGCGTNGPELLKGFDPPAPKQGEIQIVSPIVKGIEPGQDITLCSYLPVSEALSATKDIIGYTALQSTPGGHHSVFYTVQSERPVDTHECNDDDMVNSVYLAGVGGGDAGGMQAKIPDGIAYRIEAKRQLMIQTHWINTTDGVIDGQAAYNLQVTDPSDSHALAQLFTWTSTKISIPANGTATAHTTCPINRDMSFFRLGGHAHEHGTHVSMTWTAAGVDNKFYDEPWVKSYTFAPPTLDYTKDQAMVVHAGDTLSIDCSYQNDTSNEIIFPLEMCTGFGFYFPGTAQWDCTDGQWPTGFN